MHIVLYSVEGGIRPWNEEDVMVFIYSSILSMY